MSSNNSDHRSPFVLLSHKQSRGDFQTFWNENTSGLSSPLIVHFPSAHRQSHYVPEELGVKPDFSPPSTGGVRRYMYELTIDSETDL